MNTGPDNQGYAHRGSPNSSQPAHHGGDIHAWRGTCTGWSRSRSSVCCEWKRIGGNCRHGAASRYREHAAFVRRCSCWIRQRGRGNHHGGGSPAGGREQGRITGAQWHDILVGVHLIACLIAHPSDYDPPARSDLLTSIRRTRTGLVGRHDATDFCGYAFFSFSIGSASYRTTHRKQTCITPIYRIIQERRRRVGGLWCCSVRILG